MPLPKPGRREKRPDFIARCNEALAGEFPDSEQRNAVCASQWSKKTHEETMATKQISRVVLPFSIKAEGDPADAASHTFEGLAAVWDLDLGNDVIHKGAFADSIAEWKQSGEAMPLLNSHNQFDIMSALGQAVSMKETKDGLLTKWEVIDGPEGDAVMRRLRPSKTTGRSIVGKMSIGFEPQEFSFEQPEGAGPFDRIRHLTKIKLREVSLVLFPMAPGASIDAASVKAMLDSARNTDPTKLTVEEKTYLRQLASRIGNLLAKQSPAPAKPAAVKEQLPEDETDETDEDDTDELPTPEPTGTGDSTASDEDEGEGNEEGTTKLYVMGEALQQRIQKNLLKTRASAVTAKQ